MNETLPHREAPGMLGSLKIDGRTVLRGGFLCPALPDAGFSGLGAPAGQQPAARAEIVTQDILQRLQALASQPTDGDPAVQRADLTGDLSQILFQLGQNLNQFERAVTSTTTAFPARENLEAEARLLVPLDTPLRNLLPRTPGSGTASNWKQLTSLGGGWATGLDEGGTAGAIRAFFAETGAPAAHTSVYADQTAGYKLLGSYYDVTGFAMAAGATFQNQLQTEKRNAILNLMLNEEYALTAGDATSTAAPWGDGTNALAFSGLVNLIATANGTPAAQIQTSVGALTLNHIDLQLKRLWAQGARDLYMLMNGTDVMSIVHLLEGTGSIVRVNATGDGRVVAGVSLTGYVHPVSGELVDIMASRFLPAGTILFGSRRLPDGSPSADVQVLPQVQLPQLAPNDQVQGYVAQDLAPTTTAPQVYPGIVTVYEVLRMKSSLHFAKSSGVTAV